MGWNFKKTKIIYNNYKKNNIMKNVIVTGCAGFIGSQLTNVLLRKNLEFME